MSAINELGVLTANYVINFLWQIPLFFLAGWMVTKLMVKLGATVQHSIWVAVLALSVIVPAWRSDLPFRRNTSQAAGVNIQFLQAGSTADKVSAPWTTNLRLKPEIYFALLTGYVLLTGYWVGRFGWALRKTTLLRRRAKAFTLGEEINQLWSRCNQAFEITGIGIFCSEEITGPIMVGWRSPALILPPGFIESCTEEELITAFAHECAHIRRHDFLLNLIYEAATLSIAFHPCMWLIKSRIAETRELICDAKATEKMGNPSGYARSLLRLATTAYAKPITATPQGIGMFDANILEKRIMNLIKKKAPLGLAAKLVLSISGVFLLSFSCVAAYALSINVDKQGSGDSQTPTTVSFEHIYQIGPGVSPPKLLHAVDPEYPPTERKKGKKSGGICLVTMIVDTDGIPQNVHMARSLSTKFDESAMAAVRQYRFQPAIYQGKPVPVKISVEVNFKVY